MNEDMVNDTVDHQDTPLDDADSGASDGSTEASAKATKKKAKKKVAKKATTKKTAKKAVTKKPAAKKTAAKKTTKKAAATAATKKTTKKVAAQATTKKTAKKAAAKKTARETTSKKSASKKASAKSAASDRGLAGLFAAEATTETTEPIEADESTVLEPDEADVDTGVDTEVDDELDATSPEVDDSSDDSEDSDEDGSKPVKRKRSRRRRGKGGDGDAKSGDAPKAPKPKTPSVKAEMLVDYVPGEDCRIAVVEDGKLEEFYSEPTTAVSRVGNIYVGKVTNVESQIQAAFVDFGLEEAGFLHLSDLHPKYFPGADDDETERVGKKTPRRDRPPIQKCLKRGDRITVQVLKEGVGTKGPTLTSYLSIPGRYLVMMPDMDRVGVSRKVDDEDTRKKMRRILDALDLPDGFGFIVRTAGLDREQVEVERDLAYLKRLWADMERRRKKGGGPRLLYSESDLLVRTLRDQLGESISRVVINNEHALKRAHGFIKIVNPEASGGPNMGLYDGKTPIFHAFGVEEQVALMHAREVPLPSGGRLVIDQTEALVAIDVNSGKSRAARDAETNAYQTNLEAADEICRQLRLRDQGGLVICDLIDMRFASHRKSIEQRFRDRLDRDRARSTILPISDFGLLEMTRQRMRASYEQAHFRVCPLCNGRGLIQRSESVASEALRELASLLDHDRVGKVELVVSSQVAAALLSNKRMGLGRIERAFGKKVDVRISDGMGAGRYTLYAYDAGGADIDIERLPKKKNKPSVVDWKDTGLVDDEDGPGQEAPDALGHDPAAEAQAHEEAERAEADAHDEAESARLADVPLPGSESEDDEGGGKKKRRRRRRRRRSSQDADGQNDGQGEDRAEDESDEAASPPADDDAESAGESAGDESSESPESGDDTEEGGKKKRRRRRRRRRKSGDEETGDAPRDASDETEEPAAASDEDDAPAKPKRRRRRRPAGEKGPGEETVAPPASKPAAKTDPKPRSKAKPKPKAEAEPSEETPVAEVKPRRRRSLYGAGRRVLSASERARISEEG
ncbi:MAG: Rne/Rng family ribonuclease [Planctomycetota bacterium]